MARRRQQYRRRPRPAAGARPDGEFGEQALVAAASRLASAHTLQELRLLVRQTGEAKDVADREAEQSPSPDALRRFRAAAQFFNEAERALALAEGVL
jgi:hypothetical protein